MPRWSTREELSAQVVQLAKQGMGQRAIQRALGISRNTVRKIQTEHAAARETGQAALATPAEHAPRTKKVDEFASLVTELLATFPDITAKRVFEELRAKGFAGGYTAIKDHVRLVRPPPKPEPSYPTPDYGPGQMAESDWSPHTIEFTSAPRRTVQVFAYVLVHSHRKTYGLFDRCDLHALMDGHVHAFTRFGGVAHRTKYDSQKPVVLTWEGQQPIYNPRFLAFATYYEFRPEACRRFHPNDKAQVERSFWEFERSFLNGRRFRDIDDMRTQLAEWERTICDQRIHKKAKRTPLEMFAEEAPHLIPLPRHSYDTARVVYRLASMDGFVAWDGNRYAVPYDHITDILPVRITEAEIFVYAADLRLVARHGLAPRSAGRDVGGAEIHPRIGRRAATDLDQLKTAFEGIGEDGTEFFRLLVETQPRQAGHQARQILLLRERFATADIAAALRHARSYGALEHQAVARILASRAAPRKLAEYVAEETARRWAEADRGSGLEPRDLAEYDALLSAPAPDIKEGPCPSDPTTPTRSSSDSGDTSTS
ncbi:MAG: IS21 family transposase [Polyangiaceae bacterium]|nr:IS21 family transposase [Polyangiaceae bacterium]